MRAYDAGGQAYVQWQSANYDATGIDYVGGPAFNTLSNVHAAYIVPESGGGGGAFTSANSARVRTADPLPEVAGAGNTRVSSASLFGGASATDIAATTELP